MGEFKSVHGEGWIDHVRRLEATISYLTQIGDCILWILTLISSKTILKEQINVDFCNKYICFYILQKERMLSSPLFNTGLISKVNCSKVNFYVVIERTNYLVAYFLEGRGLYYCILHTSHLKTYSIKEMHMIDQPVYISHTIIIIYIYRYLGNSYFSKTMQSIIINWTLRNPVSTKRIVGWPYVQNVRKCKRTQFVTATTRAMIETRSTRAWEIRYTKLLNEA